MKNKVLISYAHLDYDNYVKPIEEALKRAQIDYWIDKSDIEQATDWDIRINRGLNQCSVFLAVVTKNYRKSEYCFYETQNAVRRFKDDPENRVILSVYIDPRLDEKLDDYFSSQQSYFFDVENMEEEIKKLLEVPALKKCSLFANLDKIDEEDYKYHGTLLGQLRHDSPIHVKLSLFYEALMTWYKYLYENENYIINSCESFDLYKHKLKDDDFKIVLSDSLKLIDKKIEDSDIIHATKKLINEIFFNDLDHPHLSLREILNKDFKYYNDLLNEYKKIYNLSLYIENDPNYVVNEKIIDYALYQFMKNIHIELDNKKEGLLTNISANNQTYINHPTLSLVKDESLKDIFLYGESGCGKTVSMVDLVNRLKENFPVLYLPLEMLSKSDSSIRKNIIENNVDGYNIDFDKLREYARTEKTFLIIDGTNEVHEHAKENLVAEVSSYGDEFSIVITSRTRDIILNKSLLQDKEFPTFTYGKYHLLTNHQISNHLKENGIELDFRKNKTLFNVLKNNLRLNMFIELVKGKTENTLDLTTPGELLYAYFFDESSNSILSKIKQDYYRHLRRDAGGIDVIYQLFNDIAKYAILNKDFKDILNQESHGQLLSSLGIFEVNNNKYDFTHSDYRYFFEALYLKDLVLDVFNNFENNVKDKIDTLSKYLLLPHVSYESLYLLANLTNIHNGNKYLYERLFKELKEVEEIDIDFINKLYVLVALGLNNSFERFDTSGLLSEIPSFMFDGCNILNAINIPEGVKTISRSAFYRCENLTNVNFPKSLQEIQSWAFVRCSNIKNIFIPENVTKIGYPAFVNCENITNITVDSNNKYFSHSADNNLLLDRRQRKLHYAANGAKIIDIPKTVTSIEPWAFKDAKHIKELYIPSRVSSISSDTFDNCWGLLNFKVGPKNKTYSSIDGLLVRKLRGSHSLVRVPPGKLDSLVIPKSVTKIEHDSISTSDNIESIYINKEVKSIGDYAFADCTNLKLITFEDLSKVTDFGKYIFLNCQKYLTIYDKMQDRRYSISEFELKNNIFNEKPEKVYQGNFNLDWNKIFSKRINFDVLVEHERLLFKAISVQRDSDTNDNRVAKIIIFGLTEYEKFSVLTLKSRKEKIISWIKDNNIVAILITRNLPIYSDLITLTKEHGCDLVSFSNASTTKVTSELESYFKKREGR